MSDSYLKIDGETYFTFFSEFNRTWEPGAVIVETIILSCVFNVALIGNIIVLLVVLIDESMRTVTNYFVSNLAFADLLFTLTIPFVIATRITESWEVGLFICKGFFYVEFVTGFCSIWTMVMISYDRYRLIVQRKKKLTTREVFIIVAVCWIVSLIGSTPMYMNFLVVDGAFVKICTLDATWSSAYYGEVIYCCTVTLVGIVLPLGIIWYTHRGIRKAISENRQRVASMSSGHPGTTGSGVNSQNMARESRVLAMLVLLVVLFGTMWMPMVIAILWIATDTTIQIDSHIFLLVWTMVAVNCSVNPIVYGVLNEHYKRRFKRFWHTMCGKPNDTCVSNQESSVI